MNEDERESLPQPLVRLCRLLARRRLAHGPDLPLAPALEDELAALVERHFRLPGPLVEAGLAGLADVEVETELEPLSCWLEPQLGPTGLLSGRRPQALVALAAGLDVLGREEHGLLGLVPGHWLATGDGRAVPDWPQVQQLLSPIRLGQRRLSPEQREQRSHLHPALARELPPRLCVHTALRFSFALFLLETLAPLHGRDLRSLLAQLELLRGLEPQLPPEVPYLLHEVLLAAALEAPCPADGCRALAEELLTVLRATVPAQAAVPVQPLSHCVDGYSVAGLAKPGCNEDRIFWSLPQPGRSCFAGVADGVSRAAVGSGRRAAACVEQLAEELQHEPAELPVDERWPAAAGAWLTSFFARAHQAIAEQTALLAGPPSTPDEVPSTMSSTLCAALLHGGRALLGWVGDSPAWRFERRRGRLIRLDVPHNRRIEQSAAAGWAAVEAGEDGGALTRALGACCWDEARQQWVAAALSPQLLEVRCAAGDLLLLGSDGLLDCLEGGDTFSREQRLACLLGEGLAAGTPLRRLAGELVRLGESELSNDNISALLVAFVAEQEP